MSVNTQHEMMQEAFLESKDIINQIFTAMKAPDDWQIRHMTFDELVAALYKILGIWNGEYRDDVTVTPETMLEGITAYNKTLEKITGIIPSIDSRTHIPGTENKVVVDAGTYVAGDQIVAGSPNLKAENIRDGVKIFDVTGTLKPSSDGQLPELEPITATSEEIIEHLFAYDEELNKVNGALKDKRDTVSDGKAKHADEKDLYVSPNKNAVYNKNSELTIPLKRIAQLLGIDPSKIEEGYEILGIPGTHKCKEINKDTNDDGEPDINIPVSEDDAPWVDPDKVKPDDKNEPIYINDDTDGDDKPNINIDTDGDGKPDLNIDTNKDGKPDVNIDTDGDGKPELNIDTDGDYKPDLNIDTDGDGKPDINIDRDEDGKPDTNIDIDGDGKAELNIVKPGEDIPSLNLDIDFDGKPELNIDTDGDGEPELNIDTNDDWIPDVNTDTNDDGKPDINRDTTGDGCADADIDGRDPSDPEIERPYEEDIDETKEGKVPGTIPNFAMDDFTPEKLAKLDAKHPDMFESGEDIEDFRLWKHNDILAAPYNIYIQAFPNSRNPLNFYYTYNTGLNEKDEESIEQRLLYKDNVSEQATDDYFEAYFGMNMVKSGNIITVSYSGPQDSIEAASGTVASSYDIDITDPRFKKVFTDYEYTEEDIQEDYTREYSHRGLRYGIFTDGLVSSRWKVSEETIVDNGHEEHIPGQEGKEFGPHVWIEVPGATPEQAYQMFGLLENRLRCPGIGRGGAYSIDFDQARRCIAAIKNAGFTEFVLKSGAGCTDGCLYDPDLWGDNVTRDVFNVDQVEEVIDYLHEIVTVLDLDITVEPSISTQIVLKHKGFLSANLRKCYYDILTWNYGFDRLGQSKVDFAVRGNEVVQGGFFLEREQYFVSETVPLDEDWEFHAVMYQAKANKDIYYGTGGLVVIPWDYGHGEPAGGELVYDEDEDKPHPIYLDPVPFENKGDVPGTLRVFPDIRAKVASYGIEPNEKECEIVEEDHEVDKIYVEVYPNSVEPLNAWWGYSSQENIHMWEERTFETVGAGHMPQPDMEKYFWLFRIAKTGSFIDVSIGVPDTKSNFGKILQPSGVGVDLLDEKWNGIWNWDPVDDMEDMEIAPDGSAPQYNIKETKHIYDLTAVHAPFSPDLKQILYFTPIEEYSGSFTVTMGSGHWFGFKVEESTDNGATFHEVANFIDMFVATHIEDQPLSVTGDHVEFHVGNAYKILTSECGAGMDFAYDFTADWNFKIGIIDESVPPTSEPQVIRVAKKGVYIGICVDGVTSSTWEFQDKDFMKYTSKAGVIPHDYSKRVHDSLVWHDISKFLPQGRVSWIDEYNGIIKQKSGPKELNYLVKLVAFSQDFETYIELSEQKDDAKLYYGNAGIIILPKEVFDETKTDDEPLEPVEDLDPTGDKDDKDKYPTNVPGTIRWWDEIDREKDYVNEEPKEKFDHIYVECCPNTIQPINFVYSYSSQEDDRVCEDMFEPDNERIKIDGGDSQGYTEDFKNLYFGMEMVKTGNIVKVSYSGPQTSEDDAETNRTEAYTIDLTDEKYQGAFDEGCHYGIYVDGVVSSRWKMVGEIGDAGDDHVVQNDKEFGVCVGGYAGVVENGCARDVYYHRSEYVADITKGALFRRFRCAGKNGGTDNKVIDLGKAKQFLKDAAAKGLDKVCVVTGDRCIATCLKSEYKTSQWFNVNDEAGLIEYLTHVGEVLGDEVVEDNVPYSKRDLFIPGTIPHSIEKRKRDSRIWNEPNKTLPAGIVKWSHEGSEIIQTGGPNELNYYLGKFMSMNKDWSFAVVLSEEVIKDDLYFGAAGVIIMPKVLDADNNGDTKPDTNIDTDDDGRPDINIDEDGDGKPDTNIDTDDDGEPDINIDEDDDGKPDLNIDENGDGKPDLNIDDNNDGKPDRNVDTNGDGQPDTNIDTNDDGKPDTNIDSNGDGIPDKYEEGDPHDPDKRNDDEDAGEKDDRMDISDDDIKDSDVTDKEKGQDNFDEDNNDPEDNPIMDDEHDGDEPEDEDHQDLLEVEDEEGKKHFVPNPTLQWAYSDYYLPMVYPTTKVHRPEKYAIPVELYKDVTKTIYVLNSTDDIWEIHTDMTKAQALTLSNIDVMNVDGGGTMTREEFLRNYKILNIKYAEDQAIVEQRSATFVANNHWVGGARSGSQWRWADGSLFEYTNWDDGEPNNAGDSIENSLQLLSNNKWNDLNDRTALPGALYERKGCRVPKDVTTTVPYGKKETIQSNEVNAAMIPFVRYAITQETRAKMYHYGNDTYLDNTELVGNIAAELPSLVSQAAGSAANILPPEGVYENYMNQWKNPHGMPGAVYPQDYISDAYTYKDGNAVEKSDSNYFLHTDYIEDAFKLYKRLGKMFEKNGEVNSYTYKKLGGGTLRESPKVNIEGESLLQVYVGDLKMSPTECVTIWRAAFEDYNDYLPVFAVPLYDTIEITDTVYDYQHQDVTRTYTKDMNDISTNNSDYSPTDKEIIKFTPGVAFNGKFELTMNTGHWYHFKIYDKEAYDANPNVEPLYVGGDLAGERPTHDNNRPQTFDAQVEFEAGKEYIVTTLECPAGGTTPDRFIYTFSLKDNNNNVTHLQVQYTVTTRERVKVPRQVNREIVEHLYLSYYDEEFRQECFQDMEDTFQDLTKYVKDHVGIQYSEHHVGNIFERGSQYTYDEKKKIAKCIHDYLIVNNVYAYGDEMNQTIYPAMSRGKRNPVCASYSLAFKYCCSRYGIVCHIVMGICDPEGEHTDEFGGNHQWNRVNYSPFLFKEKQYLHNDGKIVSSDRSMTEAMSNLINLYDADNRSHYTKDGSGDTNKLFFADPTFEGNNIDVQFIQSHLQYDKASWTDVDVTWDDSGEGDYIGNESNVGWEYFNVDSSYMKAPVSGSRIYTKEYITGTGIQCYANLVGQDSHQDQYISGKTDRYTGSKVYGW